MPKIAGAMFSNKPCIISTENDIGNSIDLSSNKILQPFIPIKYRLLIV